MTYYIPVARLAKVAVVLFTLACIACATAALHQGADFALRPGDLLFQDLDGSPLCDAIEKVTHGIDGARFSHVGMVSRVETNQVFLIEAVSAGVVETPLDKFLARSHDASGHPKVLVGRLRPPHGILILKALQTAHGFLGLPYDKPFKMDNSAFYCSELVYECFRQAGGGTPVFPLAPMTFKDPATAQTFPAWIDYYRNLGQPIPEGEPGLNPGGISRSPIVEIVHAYGRPDGWRHRAPKTGRENP